MRGMTIAAWLIVMMCCGPARAQTSEPEARAPVVAVRTGDHPGFGRVVLDVPPGVQTQVKPGEARVTVMIEGGVPGGVADLRRPRNVTAILVDGDWLDVAIAAGAKVRSSRLPGRLVIDILDAPGRIAETTAPLVKARSVPVPGLDPTLGRSGDARHRAKEDALAAPVGKPERGGAEPAFPPAEAKPGPPPSPMGIAAAPAPSSAAVTLPFGPTAAAAVFRRGDVAFLVFDERRPLDLSALRGNPILGGASVSLLPGGTLVSLPLDAGRELRLGRVDKGWTVHASEQGKASDLPAVGARQGNGRMSFTVDGPGQVVTFPDPLTGGTLLVGTQRGAGAGLPVGRRTPEFELVQTSLGIAVLPRSDAVTLRPQPGGFVLASGVDRALSMAASDEQGRAVADAAKATRRYDLPVLPVEALHRRLQAATLAAAMAPSQARTARRRDVAEALMSLGMGAEMQSVVDATMAEDVRAADDPDMIGLAAIAALLAGRPGEAVGIDNPRLTASDEVALWRAVRTAQVEKGGPRAAAVFASAMPLILSYPTPLRDRILPLALETMAQSGQSEPARAVAARLKELESLGLARAYLLEAADRPAAVTQYEKVSAGPDRRARALAARRLVELRLEAGESTAAQAADALERLVYAWRGDDVELAVRLRIAGLRADAAAWRAALAGLRETLELFPDQRATVQAMLNEIFSRSIESDVATPLSPIELVALAEENPDLIPSGPAGHRLAERLADRLLALDLPARAMPVLDKLLMEGPPGVGRAAIGARLAALHLQEGRVEAALAALAATVVEGPMPAPLLEQRTLVFARAMAGSGDLAAAVAALVGLGTLAARTELVGLQERARDWEGATATLGAMVAEFPTSGPLDEAQGQWVLRLAAVAASAGDTALLGRLRQIHSARMPVEQRHLLQVLSAAPVRDEGDLGRAALEVGQAQALPAALRTVAARSPTVPPSP